MMKHVVVAGFGFSILGLVPVAYADITGALNATIELESGCIINGTDTTDDTSGVDFGTVDFGAHTTIFQNATGQLTASGGGSNITIECTTGITPALSLQAGQNDGQGTGGGNKAMLYNDGTSDYYVTYNLLQADGTTVINVDDDIPLTNNAGIWSTTISGRAFGATGLVDGTYNDAVSVLLVL